MVDGEPTRRRGSAILVLTIIAIATLGVLQVIPPTYADPELDVRVAIIDSGIDINSELETRVVAEKSFINTSYGYSHNDNDTGDSTPQGNPHGTYIAKIIAEESPDAGIVNAKVVSDDDSATMIGIVEAIRWVVLEENCSVINLSLGSGHVESDIVGEAVKWAFDRGVCVVAAAGNNGQDGIAGSSVDSPALYEEVIAVGGIDSQLVPYGFTGRGPLRGRILKPDIVAWGYYQENGGTVFGTSFAAPIISASAVKVIAHCFRNGWSWTPGMIKAVLMISALQLPYEEWEVGAGLVDIHTALSYLDNAQKLDGLPLISTLNPTEGPFSFEYWFVNHSVSIPVSIYCSTNVTFRLAYQGIHSYWIQGPTEVTINQTGQVTLEVNVVASTDIEDVDAWVTFVAPNYLNMKTSFNFDATVPSKEIAIDVSHTPWVIDSVFGQFREMTSRINKLGISVDELGTSSTITYELLSQYDAVFVMDPCAWGYVMVNNSIEQTLLYPYTQDEIDAYYQYWEGGGGLFLAGLSNSSLDLKSANALYSAFNITMNYDIIPPISITINGVTSTAEITKIHSHPVTDFVESFDYYGSSMNYTDDAFELAWAEIYWTDANDTIHLVNRTVLVGLDNPIGGRLVASGSNFFLDNWALNDLYHSTHNWRLVIQSLYWLIHILEP
ncbi:MAG: S8 family serine peptidase [Candidatus Thorarchaeota archaeon]